jgi:hypothetical protein
MLSERYKHWYIIIPGREQGQFPQNRPNQTVLQSVPGRNTVIRKPVRIRKCSAKVSQILADKNNKISDTETLDSI